LSVQLQISFSKKILHFLTNPDAHTPDEAVALRDTKLIKYDFIWSGQNKNRLLEAWNNAIKSK